VASLTLARIQFALTVFLRIMVPAFTIGLASWPTVAEWPFLKTGSTVNSGVYRS